MLSSLDRISSSGHRRTQHPTRTRGCCLSDHPITVPPNHPIWLVMSNQFFATPSNATSNENTRCCLSDHPITGSPDHPIWLVILCYTREISTVIGCHEGTCCQADS